MDESEFSWGNFIGIQIEITEILIDTILIDNMIEKSTRILVFTRTIISIRILVISTRILVDLTRKF